MAELAGYSGGVFTQTSTATVNTTKPIGTGDAATTVFYLQETVIDCEAVSPTASGSILAGDWTSSGATAQSLTADATDEKEGTYCIKNDVTTVAEAEVCLCLFTIDDVQDWHDRAYIHFWLRCELAQSGFTSARFEVVDSTPNSSYWNLTFAATTWTRQSVLLGTPNGNSGTAADLTDIKKVQLNFVAADDTTFYQELDWIGITPQAVLRTVTITNDAVATTAFTMSPTGVVTFDPAPDDTNDLVATYSNYAIAQVVGFKEWSVSRVTDALETTDFQDSGWRTFIPGIRRWTGTVSRYWHTGTTTKITGWAGAETIVQLFLDTSVDPRIRYEGWMIASSIDITDPVEGVVEETATLQGTDWLYYEST